MCTYLNMETLCIFSSFHMKMTIEALLANHYLNISFVNILNVHCPCILHRTHELQIYSNSAKMHFR
jgi:hypothetical protein